MLIDHLATGLSFESFAGRIGTWRSTIYKWTKEHEEFSDAKKVGTEMGLLTLEQKMLAGMNDPKNFNVTAWIFYMKNRYKDLYSDKQEHQITAKPTIIKRLDGSEVVLGITDGSEE